MIEELYFVAKFEFTYQPSKTYPGKLESCVKKVCAQGKSKGAAYGICANSTGWKKAKGGGWVNERSGKKFGGK